MIVLQSLASEPRALASGSDRLVTRCPACPRRPFWKFRAWSFSGAWMLEGGAFFCHPPSSIFAPYVSAPRLLSHSHPFSSSQVKPSRALSNLVQPSGEKIDVPFRPCVPPPNSTFDLSCRPVLGPWSFSRACNLHSKAIQAYSRSFKGIRADWESARRIGSAPRNLGRTATERAGANESIQALKKIVIFL